MVHIHLIVPRIDENEAFGVSGLGSDVDTGEPGELWPHRLEYAMEGRIVAPLVMVAGETVKSRGQFSGTHCPIPERAHERLSLARCDPFRRTRAGFRKTDPK